MSSGYSLIDSILGLARWAPSGDNEQPWAFKPLSEHSFSVISTHPCRNLYSMNGWPTHLAVGCLLETIVLAAGKHSMEARFSPDYSASPERTTIQVDLTPSARPADPLAHFIEERTVNRRCLSPRRLSPEHKAILQSAVGDEADIVWIETLPACLNMVKATLLSSFIRMTIPETFDIHTKAIHWGSRFSEEGMPDAALGANRISLKMARWTFKNQKRLLFLNRYAGGTLLPHIELDFLPGLFCGAHFFLKSRTELKSVDDVITYGRKVQRLWLAAASLGIQQQPNIATLVFSEFGRSGTPFTAHQPALRQAEKLTKIVDRDVLMNENPSHVAWAGRLGYGKPSQSRSLRRPLEQLIIRD